MNAAFRQSLLPAGAGVRITAVVVALVTTDDTATCPLCGSASTAVHGRYRRTLADRPCLGRPVVYAVTGRNGCSVSGCRS